MNFPLAEDCEDGPAKPLPRGWPLRRRMVKKERFSALLVPDRLNTPDAGLMAPFLFQMSKMLTVLISFSTQLRDQMSMTIR